MAQRRLASISAAVAPARPQAAGPGLAGAGAGAGAAGANSPALAGPYDQQLGPYPVGVCSLQLDDHARPDAESPIGVRSLLTEIWYPSEEETRRAAPNLFSEFLLRGVVPGSVASAEKELSSYGRELTVAQLDEEWHNVAVRDARVRGSDAPPSGWPLVVFSHGNSATRFGYTYLCEMLASHGFIVASADHTGNSRFTLLDGLFVPMGGPRNGADGGIGQSAADRPLDIVFLIDW